MAALALTAMAVLVRPHPAAAFGALLLAAVVWAADPVGRPRRCLAAELPVVLTGQGKLDSGVVCDRSISSWMH